MAYNAEPSPNAQRVHDIATQLWAKIRKHYKIRDWVDVTVAVMNPVSMMRASCCGDISATTILKQDKTIAAILRLSKERIEADPVAVIQFDLPHAFAHIVFRLKPDLGPSFDHGGAYPDVLKTLQEMVCSLAPSVA